MPQSDPDLPPGTRLLALEEIDSTNAEAMRRAAAGEPGPLWIWARTQSLGRGRSGRTWTSVPGNLYASLLIRLDCRPEDIQQLSLLAAVAVFDAVSQSAAEQGHLIPGLRLKWPNDVLINRAKLAGILPESTTVRGSRQFAVAVGIGVNLAGHPAGLESYATHLAAHGLVLAPAMALSRIAAALDGWLRVWDLGAGFASVRRAWLERAGKPGETIIVNTGRERVEGGFIGVDKDGALVVQTLDGTQRRFTYGDVTLGAAARGAEGRA
jgi:BirA family biotin operon repressor/biotin-[acetyl-CoA-carboxylase] ligase